MLENKIKNKNTSQLRNSVHEVGKKPLVLLNEL